MTTRYPFRHNSLKPDNEQRNTVRYYSLFDSIQYKFRNRSLTTTIYGSWTLSDYNCPKMRKVIAQKVRILRNVVRG